MARNGIAPLSTTIAAAFTSGSSTTSQRPTPKKITTARTNPLAPTTERTRQVRERGRETAAGLSGVAIWEPAHAIPTRRGGQSALPGQRFTMGVAHYLCPGPQPFPCQGKRPRLRRRLVARLAGQGAIGGGV